MEKFYETNENFSLFDSLVKIDSNLIIYYIRNNINILFNICIYEENK